MSQQISFIDFIDFVVKKELASDSRASFGRISLAGEFSPVSEGATYIVKLELEGADPSVSTFNSLAPAISRYNELLAL